jgi:uncharacterized membrane protein (UPF0127 family)
MTGGIPASGQAGSRAGQYSLVIHQVSRRSGWKKHEFRYLFVSEDATLFAIEHMMPYSEEDHLLMKSAKYALELAQGQF